MRAVTSYIHSARIFVHVPIKRVRGLVTGFSARYDPVMYAAGTKAGLVVLLVPSSFIHVECDTEGGDVSRMIPPRVARIIGDTREFLGSY